MKPETAVETVRNILEKNLKGSFLSACWMSNQKPAAAFKNVRLSRSTSSVIRTGIEFKNLKDVKEGIANEERPEVGPMLNSEWILYPFLAKTTKDNLVFRVYPVKGAKMNTSFFVDEIEVAEDVYMGYLTPSDQRKFHERENRECFSVNVENIELFID